MIKDNITNEELVWFIEDLTAKYSTEDKLKESEETVENLKMLLRKKKLLVEGVQQTFIEVLYASAYVYNLFVEEAFVTSLFKLREIINSDKDIRKPNRELLEAVLQTTESQYGEDTPIPLCKPAQNSPTETFAMAVWLTNNYNRK